MLDLRIKTSAEIQECIKAQEKYCCDSGAPLFAPSDGICWKCHQNIYQNVGWRVENYSRHRVPLDSNDVSFITGISLEKAGTQLVTGCPHCNYSYCN